MIIRNSSAAITSAMFSPGFQLRLLAEAVRGLR